MKQYFCPRGTVVNTLGSKESGMYKIAGLNQLKGDYPLLIRSVVFDKKDVLVTVSCLNNVKVVYSFGQDFGNVAVSGVILLGPISTGARSENLRGLLRWFENNRSSKTRRPVKVSILNSKAERFYLQSLRLGEPDVDTHVQPFVITGVLIE